MKYFFFFLFLCYFNNIEVCGQNKVYDVKEITYRRFPGSSNILEFTYFSMYIKVNPEGKAYLSASYDNISPDGTKKLVGDYSCKITQTHLNELLEELYKLKFSQDYNQIGIGGLGAEERLIHIIYGNNDILEIVDEEYGEHRTLAKLHKIFDDLRFNQDWKKIDE